MSGLFGSKLFDAQKNYTKMLIFREKNQQEAYVRKVNENLPSVQRNKQFLEDLFANMLKAFFFSLISC